MVRCLGSDEAECRMGDEVAKKVESALNRGLE
jgi:hypothetical protein